MASGFLQDAAGEPIVAKCPPSDAEDTSNEFCKCDQNPSRSNRVITIKCKFNDKEVRSSEGNLEERGVLLRMTEGKQVVQRS